MDYDFLVQLSSDQLDDKIKVLYAQIEKISVEFLDFSERFRRKLQQDRTVILDHDRRKYKVKK